jgi:hypothetical protein
MDQSREQLEACISWGKECRIEWGIGPSQEIVAVVSDIRNGLVVLSTPYKGTMEIPLDDIVEILHPVLVENEQGVFEVKRSGPTC